MQEKEMFWTCTNSVLRFVEIRRDDNSFVAGNHVSKLEGIEELYSKMKAQGDK